jgi:hypothetical protein
MVDLKKYRLVCVKLLAAHLFNLNFVFFIVMAVPEATE